MNEVTRILSAIEQGDPRAAEQLLPLVYAELRQLAAQRLTHEKPGQTLQATAPVHEAYLRLMVNPEPHAASGEQKQPEAIDERNRPEASRERERPSVDEPLSLAAFVADTPVRAYFEPLAVGQAIPPMPLFLDPDHYVNTPLETTYQTTWSGTPELLRAVLEATQD